jgi:hypothetical protein
MFPSSPVSVGIMPSNRTLEFGVSQILPTPSSTKTEEQRPTSEEPFTERAKSGIKNREGTTGKEGEEISFCWRIFLPYLVRKLILLEGAEEE